MSWNSFEQTLSRMPRLGPVARRVARALGKYPSGAVVDPVVLRHDTNATDLELLAALNLMRENGLGKFGVAVLNNEGQRVAVYPNRDAVPHLVIDDYGDELVPDASSMHVVFIPALDSAASDAA